MSPNVCSISDVAKRVNSIILPETGNEVEQYGRTNAKSGARYTAVK